MANEREGILKCSYVRFYWGGKKKRRRKKKKPFNRDIYGIMKYSLAPVHRHPIAFSSLFLQRAELETSFETPHPLSSRCSEDYPSSHHTWKSRFTNRFLKEKQKIKDHFAMDSVNVSTSVTLIKNLFRNGEKAGEADCQREEAESRRAGARSPAWRREGGTWAPCSAGAESWVLCFLRTFWTLVFRGGRELFKKWHALGCQNSATPN